MSSNTTRKRRAPTTTNEEPRRSTRKKRKPANLFTEIISNPASPRAQAYFFDHPDVSLDELDQIPGPSDLEWLQQELQDALDEETGNEGVQLIDLATDGVQELRRRLLTALQPQEDTGADLSDFVASDGENTSDSDGSFRDSGGDPSSSSDNELTDEDMWESGCIDKHPERFEDDEDTEEEEEEEDDDEQDDETASDLDVESGADTGDEAHEVHEADENDEEDRNDEEEGPSAFSRRYLGCEQKDDATEDVWY